MSDREEAHRLRAEGKSLSQIGEALGASKEWVRRLLLPPDELQELERHGNGRQRLKRAFDKPPCPTCGGKVGPLGRRYCRAECRPSYKVPTGQVGRGRPKGSKDRSPRNSRRTG